MNVIYFEKYGDVLDRTVHGNEIAKPKRSHHKRKNTGNLASGVLNFFSKNPDHIFYYKFDIDGKKVSFRGLPEGLELQNLIPVTLFISQKLGRGGDAYNAIILGHLQAYVLDDVVFIDPTSEGALALIEDHKTGIKSKLAGMNI